LNLYNIKFIADDDDDGKIIFKECPLFKTYKHFLPSMRGISENLRLVFSVAVVSNR